MNSFWLHSALILANILYLSTATADPLFQPSNEIQYGVPSEAHSVRRIVDASGKEIRIGGGLHINDECQVVGDYEYILTKAPRYGLVCYRTEISPLKHAAEPSQEKCVGVPVKVNILYYYSNGLDYGFDDLSYLHGPPGQVGFVARVYLTLTSPSRSQPRDRDHYFDAHFQPQALDFIPECSER